MHITSTIPEIRTTVRQLRQAGRRVALVPTMGALHDGHLSLIRAAAAGGAAVVVSVFVNPAQFDDPEDLRRYPVGLERDAAMAETAGAEYVFAPTADEMYPEGFSTSVHVSGVSERWEGADRGSSHFDGVALVVTKLLTIVLPDDAWFGQKDAQQVAVVTRMSRDLDLPVTIRTGPTVRDADGLALSSRNSRLRPEDRAAALSVHASLRLAQGAVEAGETDAAAIASRARAAIERAGATVEYWAVVDPEDFVPLSSLAPGQRGLAIVAAVAGEVRLLDNARITAPPESAEPSRAG